MFKNSNIINKIKKFNSDLDREYGSGKNNKKDTIIGFTVFLCVFIYSTFMVFNSLNKLFILLSFIYSMAITFSALMIIILGYLYYNPKNNIKNKKKKTFLKIILIIAFLLFFGMSSPVLIFVFAVDKISMLFGIQIFIRNIHIIILDLLIYIFAYLSCVGNYQIYELNIIKYLLFISVIYFITYKIRKTIYIINSFISYREKYEYLYKSQSALIYIINILAIFSGVAGLYISKFNNGEFSVAIIYYIMPIIIFGGLEQITLHTKQNKSERIKFIQNLYEDLIILYDISYSQITNFSCIKIKIKIKITPYIIENYKEYYFSKRKRKDKMFIEALDECKRMLIKDYAVYLEDEKKNFEKDLVENIDRLAKCLTIMKK